MARPGIRAKTPAITAARLMASGDASGARAVREGMQHRALSVSEARALIGGARAAKKRYGANVDVGEFLFGRSRRK